MSHLIDINFSKESTVSMPKGSEVRMIDLEFTEEDKKALNYERYHHPHPCVQRKMEALWLKSQGVSHKQIARFTGISINVVTKYLKDYQTGGIEKLKELDYRGQPSRLNEHRKSLEDYFKAHPPATLKEAMDAIERLTGLKRSEKQIKKFISKLGFKRRKAGSVPSKADLQAQETFKKNTWNPVLRKPKPEKGHSFLWMPPILS
jgi:transposase